MTYLPLYILNTVCNTTFFFLAVLTQLHCLLSSTIMKRPRSFFSTQGEPLIKELLALLSVFLMSVIKCFGPPCFISPPSASLCFEDEARIIPKKKTTQKRGSGFVFLFSRKTLQSAEVGWKKRRRRRKDGRNDGRQGRMYKWETNDEG